MAFIDRIALFDKNGVFQTVHPSSVMNEKDSFSDPSSNTADWIGEDQTGVSILLFRSTDDRPVVEFIATTLNPSGQRNGFLIGQVDIQEHPFLSDVILEFENIASYDSGGKIITKDGEILYQNVLG